MPRTLPLLLLAVALAASCAPEPQPGEFVAGSASVLMPVPLGVGTVGYNGMFGAPDNPSPYADRYPATERLHGHPELTAIAMSRGEGFEVIVLRTDMIATVQQVRDAVVAELEQRTGRNYDHALIMTATHTHSGPGRWIQGGLYDLIADYFVPEFYSSLVGAMADVVEAALADLGPAEMGYTLLDVAEAHSDRRCADGVEYTNDQLGLIAVRKDGEVTSVIVNYAIHGTILDIEDFTLSKDVSGAIEEKVRHTFDHPVDVVLVNSWAGDVAPHSPGIPAPAVVSPLPPGYDQMDEIGLFVADAVAGAIDSVPMTSEPTIRSQTWRYPIDRQAIGYDYSEFEYEWGGVYCNADENCDELTDHPDMTDGCIPFPEDSPAPLQSVFTVGELAGANFTTWSGESTTGLAEEAMAAMREAGSSDDVLFFGYSQDYLGYSLQEEDWWHGGYEASGSMWGPRQGEYMKAVQREIFDVWLGMAEELSYVEPGLPTGFSTADGVVWTPESAIDSGVVSVQPAPTYAAADIATFEIQGSDPIWGVPVATLQRGDGAEFVDVTTPDGAAWSSNGYGFWVDLAPDPPYEETLDNTDRIFRWTFSLPLSTRAASFGSEAGTSFRFRVVLPTAAGMTEELTSDPFTVE